MRSCPLGRGPARDWAHFGEWTAGTDPPPWKTAVSACSSAGSPGRVDEPHCTSAPSHETGIIHKAPGWLSDDKVGARQRRHGQLSSVPSKQASSPLLPAQPPGGGSGVRRPGPGSVPSPDAALLTWSQLDLQRSPNEGHQRGREVDSHVLVGDGHVHANQALGTRGAGQGQACQGPSTMGRQGARGP